MSRVSVIARVAIVLVAGTALTIASCSKSKESAQKGGSNEGPALAGGVGDPPKDTGAHPRDVPPTPATTTTSDNPAFHLQPSEGTLAIEVPSDAKPGAETTAKITVTPADGYHINMEYPTKLSLEQPSGIVLAKATQTAGGSDKQKGDADAFAEGQLAFAVKLTPAAAGDYTVTGSFKFAVCDKDQCLPKKETVTLKVAAK